MTVCSKCNSVEKFGGQISSAAARQVHLLELQFPLREARTYAAIMMWVVRLLQDAQDVAAARQMSLPPLQSVVELTTAYQPPQRGEEPVSAQSAPSSAGANVILGIPA